MRLGKTPEFVGVGPEKLIGIMSTWNGNLFRKLKKYPSLMYVFEKPIKLRFCGLLRISEL